MVRCGAQCATFSLCSHHRESEKQIHVCKLLYSQSIKGSAPGLGVKPRAGQSSSWHTAGQVSANSETESLVLVLAVLLTLKMDFVNSPHPPPRDGDHTCLFCRTVLPSLHVWYGIRGCMKYGHHFMTFNMVNSW